MRRKNVFWNVLATIMILSFLASACGQDVVEVTRVVTEKETIVQKETVVETVRETVIVEGTPQVVEKEATRVVEVEKPVEVVVTATPEPSGISRELVGKIEGPEIITDPSQFPTEFSEAPELAAMVETGELPPVEERLPEPEDLLVIKPLDQIGTYGGVWRRGFTGPGDGYNAYRCCSGTDYPLFKDPTWTEIIPNVAKDWEMSEDGRTITLYLRRGMRWSDGQPFTADDWMFWYEDIFQYEGLAYRNSNLETNGVPLVMEKVDDYTIRIEFQDPYSYFLDQLAGGFGPSSSAEKALFAPKHYLSQFHPKYVGEDAANSRAEEEGYETWVKLFTSKANWNKNTELPSLTPWIQVVPNTEPVWVLERNPYYWGVDTAGNQLPYIDRVEMTLADNLEVINLRAIAGEYDLQARHLDIAKLPVFLENQEKAGYRVNLDPGGYGSEYQIRFNQNFDLDPELNKWFQNTDFRRALSLGVDRDQINEAFFLGLGVPGSPIPDPSNPYYPGDEYRTLWHTYDPGTANEMLDAIGLDKKDAEGFRLRTDNGERMVLVLTTVGGQFVPFTAISEMIQDQWRDIGIYADVKEVDRALLDEWESSGEVPLYIWNNDGTDHELLGNKKVLPCTLGTVMGIHYGEWYVTHGEEGLEPPPRIKEALEMMRAAYSASEEERYRLGQEIWKIAVDEVLAIGTVGLAPGGMALRVVNTHMGNVPERMVNGPRPKNPASARPQTFFFEE
jgi:peptide/nickel transport system substrate-binding protein